MGMVIGVLGVGVGVGVGVGPGNGVGGVVGGSSSQPQFLPPPSIVQLSGINPTNPPLAHAAALIVLSPAPVLSITSYLSISESPSLQTAMRSPRFGLLFPLSTRSVAFNPSLRTSGTSTLKNAKLFSMVFRESAMVGVLLIAIAMAVSSAASYSLPSTVHWPPSCGTMIWGTGTLGTLAMLGLIHSPNPLLISWKYLKIQAELCIRSCSPPPALPFFFVKSRSLPSAVKLSNTLPMKTENLFVPNSMLSK